MAQDAQTAGAVAARTIAVEVISFSYGRGDVPQADLTVDTRYHFGTVHGDPHLMQLTAADTEVREAVMLEPGVGETIEAIVWLAHTCGIGEHGGPIRIAIGGVDGKHTSAVIAAGVARFLGSEGAKVTLTHREIGQSGGEA